MSATGEVLAVALQAFQDLSAVQYHAVRASAGANQASIASNSAVLHAIGILQNDPKSGMIARCAYIGESKAVAGAAITAGVKISHNSSGRVIAATSGICILGTALEAANADGDIIRILLTPGQALGQI